MSVKQLQLRKGIAEFPRPPAAGSAGDVRKSKELGASARPSVFGAKIGEAISLAKAKADSDRGRYGVGLVVFTGLFGARDVE